MHVLFVSHDASRTGAPLLLLHLLRWLRGHTPWSFEVLLADGGELCADFAAVAPVSVLGPWTSELTLRAVSARLRRRRVVGQLKSAAPSLVYSNTATNGDVLDLLGGGQPVISHIHELSTSIRSYGDANFAAVRRHTTRYIACANAVKDDLVEAYGISPADVDVVHGFIPVSPLDPRKYAAQRCAVRAELGIPEDAFVVGGAGLVTWRKAPDVFIGLARAVALRSPAIPVHFVWVGGMSETIRLHQLQHDVRGVGLEGRVQFIGSRPNAVDYFQAIDVFAMVSREDPFPLVGLEAASVGKPIVCFDYAGGMKEFVEKDCGFVVPYLDVDAMADAVATLMRSPELRCAQGGCAAERVRLRHDIDIAAPKIASVIEGLL